MCHARTILVICADLCATHKFGLCVEGGTNEGNKQDGVAGFAKWLEHVRDGKSNVGWCCRTWSFCSVRAKVAGTIEDTEASANHETKIN